jgi:hypothetical protein
MILRHRGLWGARIVRQRQCGSELTLRMELLLHSSQLRLRPEGGSVTLQA